MHKFNYVFDLWSSEERRDLFACDAVTRLPDHGSRELVLVSVAIYR